MPEQFSVPAGTIVLETAASFEGFERDRRKLRQERVWAGPSALLV